MAKYEGKAIHGPYYGQTLRSDDQSIQVGDYYYFWDGQKWDWRGP